MSELDANARETTRVGDRTESLRRELEQRVAERTAELELARDEAEQERRRLRQLLGRLQQGVISVDQELRVDFANSTARRYLAPNELVEGAALPAAWCDFPLADFASTLFADAAEESEGQVVDEDAERVYAIAGLPPRARRALLVVTDVTERERRERAERDFVTNAAHELRTPLAAIVSAVEVLQGGAKDDAAARELFLHHIHRQADRLTRLTHSLLLLARLQRDEDEPARELVELGPLLSGVARDAEPADGVTVTVDCDASVAVVGNKMLIEQALANLVANATRHTAAGSIVLSARMNGRRVDIEVRDTGSGIDAGDEARVFDRFFSGADGGFGLGLAIVREAIEALDGTVKLERGREGGTVARVCLPAAELVRA